MAIVGAFLQGIRGLFDFQQQESMSGTPWAHLTFMPDPLCATLAMRYMDVEWNKWGFQGRDGKFWVEQAEKAFSTKLCLPEKGDVGEIFAALYMLLCGDILRKEEDKKKEKEKGSNQISASFSVLIDDWFGLLKTGGKAKNADADKTTHTGKDKHVTISFVQVCRNDFRSNSFGKKKVLQRMYMSGLASYAYKNCKAIDIASSIKVVHDSEISYHPLLISVKNWVTVWKSDVSSWLSSLKKFVEEMRPNDKEVPAALCLIILLGCSNPPDMQGGELSDDKLDPFPDQDVYRLVTVPEQDEFGISNAIHKLGMVSEDCEIYSSHGFLYSETDTSVLLRKKSKKTEQLQKLFEGLNGLDSNEEQSVSNT